MTLEESELWFAKLQFDMKKRVMMYKKIASFSKQSVPIFNTLEMFEQAYSLKSGDARGPILREWIRVMREGGSFSEAIKGFVPDAEVMLIAAGEANGDIEGGMKKAVFVTEAARRIRSALIVGLSYSAVLIMTLMGMITLFSIKVIPQMVEVMPVQKWPAISQNLYLMATLVKDYGAYAVGGFILFLFVSIQTLGIFQGRIRAILDWVPPWNIYKTIQGSVFLITLSAMMGAGVPLNNALGKIRELSSLYTAAFIGEMMVLLSAGSKNGEALNVGLLDYDTALDITLLGRTADFQSAMMMLGEETIENTVDNINMITKGVGTAILFLITAFVIFVYSGFFFLTQAITNNANHL